MRVMWWFVGFNYWKEEGKNILLFYFRKEWKRWRDKCMEMHVLFCQYITVSLYQHKCPTRLEWLCLFDLTHNFVFLLLFSLNSAMHNLICLLIFYFLKNIFIMFISPFFFSFLFFFFCCLSNLYFCVEIL